MFNRKTPVAEVMTRKVKSVGPNTTMDVVADIFASETFHHLPVVEGGKVVGISSSTELHMLEDHFTLFRQGNLNELNKKILRSLLAKEVMTKKVAKVGPEDTVDYAVDIFRENLFHALPVVNQEKELVGIITPYDIMTWAFRMEPAQIE